MNLPEYVRNHLIDLDLMSKSELRDLIESVYDQVHAPNYFMDTPLFNLLVDLNYHLDS
jgi:hypothetical protein